MAKMFIKDKLAYEQQIGTNNNNNNKKNQILERPYITYGLNYKLSKRHIKRAHKTASLLIKFIILFVISKSQTII